MTDFPAQTNVLSNDPSDISTDVLMIPGDNLGESKQLVWILSEISSDTSTDADETAFKSSGWQNVTASPNYADKLLYELEVAFIMAQEEIFEDGFENDFSLRLSALARIYKSLIVDGLAGIVLQSTTNAEIAAQALRWLGRTEEAISNNMKRIALERIMLQSSSAQIRDGALIGLGYISDPKSIESLKQAIAHEAVADLKEDMVQYLEYLKGLANTSSLRN